MIKVLVTGAGGFIGKNLLVHLRARPEYEVDTLCRGDAPGALAAKVASADFIFHLAGVNRPESVEQFAQGNTDLTRRLCDAVRATGRGIPIVFSSSIQAAVENPYGVSKRAAEEALHALASAQGAAPVYVYRLPNVFGKWCRPNYNSAVATFCHNIVNDLPVSIHDPQAMIRLVYIDDVVADFLRVLAQRPTGGERAVAPEYAISVGGLAEQLNKFKDSRLSLVSEAVGTGLVRALYSTYISYFRPEQFTYPLVKHEDPRGVFVEMLKTPDAGQFSYFTAHPGITRGGHYHHTKTEKFLVIKGQARFGFRHIDTGDTYSVDTDGATPVVVETVPGWSHDITNVGTDDMVVMLWANEIFDRGAPDTINYKV